MAEITDLLLMQQQLRECQSMSELGHLIVNDSSRIIDYQVAVLWLAKNQSGSVVAVSGLPEPVKHTPFSDWIDRLCSTLNKQQHEKTIIVDDHMVGASIALWQEFIPDHAIWIPLQSGTLGGILLARPLAWNEAESSLADYWAGAIEHAINALKRKRSTKVDSSSHFLVRHMPRITAVTIFLSMFLPIEQSVNAQAVIVAKDPLVIRSSLDGIVGEVLIQPNGLVQKDDLLLTFDDTSIRTQLDVVNQELEIAKAEYRRADQAAISDRRAASQLPVLRARIEQRNAERDYVFGLLDRTKIVAEKQGIAIIGDAQDLEGRPVRIGQVLMTIASPKQVEIEFWLAVGDSLSFGDNNKVTLFPNVAPDTAYQAVSQFINYEAEVSPDGIFAFRGRASLAEGEQTPRIGWRGVVKLRGDSVSLFYYLFRKPIAVVRQWTGI